MYAVYNKTVSTSKTTCFLKFMYIITPVWALANKVNSNSSTTYLHQDQSTINHPTISSNFSTPIECPNDIR